MHSPAILRPNIGAWQLSLVNKRGQKLRGTTANPDTFEGIVQTATLTCVLWVSVHWLQYFGPRLTFQAGTLCLELISGRNLL